jgi:outer membrane protein
MRSFLIFLALFGSLMLSSQNTWDLQQCVDYALKHNIGIQQAEINSQINKNNALQSKAGVLPTLNAGAAHTYNFGRTIDRYTNTFANTQVLSQNFYVSSNFVLWSGFSQLNNIKANEYGYLSSVESVKQSRNDLSINVATAYINVIYTDEYLKIAKNQFDITKQQLDRTQVLADAGTLATSAVYDIKAQLANEEVNVITADNNYQIAMLTLRQLMNLDSLNNFNVQKPDIDVQSATLAANSVQNIYETALKNQPSIKSAEYNVIRAEKTLAAARGRYSPTLSMTGSIGTGYSGLAKNIKAVNIVGYDTTAITSGGQYVFSPKTELVTEKKPFVDQFNDNVNKSIGFTLSVPLFNGLNTYTSVKNSQLSALNAKFSKDLAEQNLYKLIAQAYANARAALNKYVASKSSVEANQQSFNFAQQKFNVGAISAFDFNQAKTRLASAQSTLLQSKYDYLFKLKVLDFYQGKPLTF